MFALFEKRPTCCSCWTSPAARRACRSTSAAIPSWCRWKRCPSSPRLRGRRQGGRHPGRDRPDPHGLRARHSHRGHHGAPAVQRAQPQPVVPSQAASSSRRKGSFVFLRLFKYLWPERYLPEPEQDDPFNEDPPRARGQGRRAAGEPGHPGRSHGQGYPQVPGRIPVRPARDRNSALSVEADIAWPGADPAPEEAGAALRRHLAAGRLAADGLQPPPGRGRGRGAARGGRGRDGGTGHALWQPVDPGRDRPAARAGLRAHPDRAALSAVRRQHHRHGGGRRDPPRGRLRDQPELRFIKRFHEDAFYLDALAGRIESIGASMVVRRSW